MIFVQWKINVFSQIPVYFCVAIYVYFLKSIVMSYYKNIIALRVRAGSRAPGRHRHPGRCRRHRLHPSSPTMAEELSAATSYTEDDFYCPVCQEVLNTPVRPAACQHVWVDAPSPARSRLVLGPAPRPGPWDAAWWEPSPPRPPLSAARRWGPIPGQSEAGPPCLRSLRPSPWARAVWPRGSLVVAPPGQCPGQSPWRPLSSRPLPSAEGRGGTAENVEPFLFPSNPSEGWGVECQNRPEVPARRDPTPHPGSQVSLFHSGSWPPIVPDLELLSNLAFQSLFTDHPWECFNWFKIQCRLECSRMDRLPSYVRTDRISGYWSDSFPLFYHSAYYLIATTMEMRKTALVRNELKWRL